MTIEVGAVQLYVANSEARIEASGLVREGCQARSKREQEGAVGLQELPRSAGIEDQAPGAFNWRVGPAGPDVDVSAAAIGEKGLVRPDRRRGQAVIIGDDTNRDVADREKCFVRNQAPPPAADAVLSLSRRQRAAAFWTVAAVLGRTGHRARLARAEDGFVGPERHFLDLRLGVGLPRVFFPSV